MIPPLPGPHAGTRNAGYARRYRHDRRCSEGSQGVCQHGLVVVFGNLVGKVECAAARRGFTTVERGGVINSAGATAGEGPRSSGLMTVPFLVIGWGLLRRPGAPHGADWRSLVAPPAWAQRLLDD